MRNTRSLVLCLSALAAGCSAQVRDAWPDGSPRRAGTLSLGEQEGVWTYWHPGGARKEAEGPFRGDKQHGAWMYWHANGAKRSEGAYEDGLRTGAWRHYHENGALESEGAFVRDLQDGRWRDFLRDGSPATERQFVRGALSPSVPPPQPEPTSPAVPSPPSPPTPTPLPLLPGFWTPRQEAMAADLVAGYTARPKGFDVYGAPVIAPDPKADQKKELIGKPLPQTRLITSRGEVLDLGHFEDKRCVVLVILRGFAGQVCIYCSAQTTALARNLKRFKEAATEVALVYPGPAESVPAFVAAVKTLGADANLFPILLDPDLRLVRALGIEDKLSKPTVLILDGKGIVRFSHVSSTVADRPSVEEILEATRLQTR